MSYSHEQESVIHGRVVETGIKVDYIAQDDSNPVWGYAVRHMMQISRTGFVFEHSIPSFKGGVVASRIDAYFIENGIAHIVEFKSGSDSSYKRAEHTKQQAKHIYCVNFNDAPTAIIADIIYTKRSIIETSTVDMSGITESFAEHHPARYAAAMIGENYTDAKQTNYRESQKAAHKAQKYIYMATPEGIAMRAKSVAKRRRKGHHVMAIKVNNMSAVKIKDYTIINSNSFAKQRDSITDDIQRNKFSAKVRRDLNSPKAGVREATIIKFPLGGIL